MKKHLCIAWIALSVALVYANGGKEAESAPVSPGNANRAAQAEMESATTGSGGTAPAPYQVPQTVTPEAVSEGDGVSLAEAIEQSARELRAELPEGTRVAIAGFDSEHENLSGYIMEELTGALVNGGLEVTDRRNLPFVYKELNFQMSGDVSDESAVSVGKFVGARYVLTGQLVKTGGQYRYRLTAIDVETALQESSIRINVRDDWGFRNLLTNLRENPVQPGSAGKPKTPLENTAFGNTYAPAAFREQKGRCRVSERILEYFLYDTGASGAASADAVKFLTQAFMRYAEELGWTIDYENISYIKNNTGLSPAVKALMNTKQCDVSMTLVDEGIAYIAVNIFSGNDVYAFYDYPLLYAAGTAGAHLDRGILFASRDDYDLAIQEFTESIKLNPNNAAAYRLRGIAYDDGKHDYDRAIADFSQAIEFASNDPVAYFDRGLTYSRRSGNTTGDYNQIRMDQNRALGDYTQAITLNPFYAAAYRARGDLYQTIGVVSGDPNFYRAIEDYTQAIMLEPNNAEAYDCRGYVYFNGLEEIESDRAIADYTQAIRIDPKFVRAYINRADVYFYKNDYKRARADWEQALRLDPNNADARANLERLKKEGR